MKRTTLKRSSPMNRGPGPKRGGKIKTRRKTKAEVDAKFAREYHSEARREWVERRPCVGCGGGPCENHHIVTEGMGRKAHHSLIVPLCWNCHREIHGVNCGRHTFEQRHRVSLAVAAEETHKAWWLHEHGQPFHEAPRQSDAHD